MKILIVAPSYKPAFTYGGPTFSISKLAEILNNVIYIQVVTTTANGNNELNVQVGINLKVDNVNVIYFKRETKDHSHFSFGLLKYLWINCKKYDIVHIQSWWNLVSLFSVAICLIKNCRVVLSPRGMLSNYTISNSKFKSITHSLFKVFIYKKLNLHLTSEYEFLQTIELNAKSNYTIPNFLLSTEGVRCNTFEKSGLLFLSRIEKKKNIEALINSMKYLSDSIILNIVGNVDNEYYNYLKSLIPSNVENRINWLGPIYGKDKNVIIAKSKLLVLPSHDENFANVILESLLNGTAVVISNKVGLADFVQRFNLGWIINTEDKIEDVLNNALLDTDKLNFINENAREIVLREFDDEKLIKQYLEMYNHIKYN